MVKLIALRDFSPDGSRKLKTGERFTMTESSARLLIALNRARLDEEPVTETKRTYKRRDMVAEKD